MTQENQTQTDDKKYLTHASYSFEITREYKDCKVTTALVYSYMLCRYEFFKSKNQRFFESTAEMADSINISESTVRLAIDWLKANGFVEVSKKKGMKHFNNCYVVQDKYNLYTNFQTNLKKKETHVQPTVRTVQPVQTKPWMNDNFPDIESPF